MIKSLSKPGLKENFLNPIKEIHQNPTVNSIHNEERLNKYFPRPVLSPYTMQNHTGGPSQCSKTGRRNKRHPDWKGKKNTVFIDFIIVYIKNSKEFFYKPLDLLSKFSKVAGYRVSVFFNCIFIYILAVNNWKLKFKKLPFTVASQNMNCLVINLTNMQDLCDKVYKILRETNRVPSKWKDKVSRDWNIQCCQSVNSSKVDP